jgi:hypothetical protein
MHNLSIMVWNIFYSFNKILAILFLILAILMGIRNLGGKEQLLLYLHLSVLLILIVFQEMLEVLLY